MSAPRVCFIGNSNLPNSENGRLLRDGNTVPNQTQNSSKQQVSDLTSRRRGFQLKNTKTSKATKSKATEQSKAKQQRAKLPITVATRAKSPLFQSSANEIENLSKVCETFCLLEQKVQQACKTCQSCRFRNRGVNQTQFPSLPSLPFSELVPIKHTPSVCILL